MYIYIYTYIAYCLLPNCLDVAVPDGDILVKFGDLLGELGSLCCGLLDVCLQRQAVGNRRRIILPKNNTGNNHNISSHACSNNTTDCQLDQ